MRTPLAVLGSVLALALVACPGGGPGATFDATGAWSGTLAYGYGRAPVTVPVSAQVADAGGALTGTLTVTDAGQTLTAPLTGTRTGTGATVKGVFATGPSATLTLTLTGTFSAPAAGAAGTGVFAGSFAASCGLNGTVGLTRP